MDYSFNPRHSGVPHDEWRNGQYDALNWFEQNGRAFTFLELPTGIGKSAIPTAIGSRDDVTVLVSTLGLLDQYHEQYGFDIIKGRSNYLCVLSGKVDLWKRQGKPDPTAAECHYSKMNECPERINCPYLRAKEIGIASNRLAVTYKYAFLSFPVRKRTGVLVCDEAHELVNQIIGFSEFKITERIRQKWDLPEFPYSHYGNGRGDELTLQSTIVVNRWLSKSIEEIESSMAYFSRMSTDYIRAERNLREFQKIRDAITGSKQFLECGANLIKEYKKNRLTISPGLRIRSLDASQIANRLWENKQRALLMSATIGDPSPPAKAIGIQYYDWKTYPHPIPIDRRPIYDLGVPKMTHANLRANPNLYNIQAIIISKWINKLNSEWRGIVLTSSYKKIEILSSGLQQRLTNRRIITQMPGVPLTDIITQFITDKRPGDVLVASIQGFGSGLDLQYDLARFAVIAGVPHSNPSDRYEQYRKRYNGKLCWWEAYNAVVQACGRVSRGESDSNNGYLLNVAAIADGSATTNLALKYYPKWFAEAFVKC